MPEDPDERSALYRMLAVLALLGVMVTGFAGDWKLVTGGGSIDLRNRVTGARALSEGLDPYHLKWQRGMSERLCDPYNNAAMTVSLTTVTPTFLFLMLGPAMLDYEDVQVLWLMVEWLCLLGTGMVWWWLLGAGWRRWVWAVLVASFSHTLAWKHHVDRGQMYVVLLCLLSLWVALTWAGKKRMAGWVVGLLLCLRPPLLLALAPFVVLRGGVGQWRTVALSACLFALMPMLLKAGVWQDYFAGMAQWSEVYRAGEKPRPPAQSYPAEIEGIPLDKLAHYEVRQTADSSIIRILKGYGVLNFPQWPLGLALTLGIAAWWRRYGSNRQEELVAGVLAWAFLTDWFLPAYRHPYNDVLVCAVLAAVLWTGRRSVWLMLAGVGAGWWFYEVLPSARWQSHLPTVLLLVAGVSALWPKNTHGKAARS